ncbi:hypothetical protein NZD85_05930 [Empedobacter stercoris]|nr:hypothetical protein [Empedobacter stercoris]UWX68138.1 hypothetical protein NZD85_05930 [Empedobacter stercoris]
MNNPFEPLVDLLTKIDQKLDRLNLKTKVYVVKMIWTPLSKN